MDNKDGIKLELGEGEQKMLEKLKHKKNIERRIKLIDWQIETNTEIQPWLSLESELAPSMPQAIKADFLVFESSPQGIEKLKVLKAQFEDALKNYGDKTTI